MIDFSPTAMVAQYLISQKIKSGEIKPTPQKGNMKEQKYKEIEVWISNKVLNHDSEVFSVFMDEAGGKGFNQKLFSKAKLLVPVQEKKVDITESEFDEAWKECCSYPFEFPSYFKIRQKLFGKDV